MTVKIFAEGKDHKSRPLQFLRLGFQDFFRNGLPAHKQPDIEMCGPRGTAHRDFCNAVKKKTSTFNILLVDSEKPVSAGNTTWQHLKSSDNWDNCGTSDDQCHLMVQATEAWIIADIQALKTFYGGKLEERHVANLGNIGQISPKDLVTALKKATYKVPRKIGTYHKTKHTRELLSLLDVNLVRSKAPHCNLLFRVLEQQLTPL
ncbi:DUF4276 family protein [bacterium]|nr:DUF4276 family protein [bacterium]MBU1025001.1 DUF4276 family protein [bacterium]